MKLEKPDKVPILEWSINPKVISKLEPNIGVREFMAQHLDTVTTFWNDPNRQDSQDVVIDQWGIKRKFGGQNYAIPFEYPIKRREDLLDYTAPDPLEDDRLDYLKTLVKRYKGKVAIAFLLETVLTYAWGLVGMEQFFRYLKLEPDFAKSLCNISFDYHYTLAEKALEMGADIVMCGDDLAYKKGLLISPEDFETFLLPYYKKMINLVHSYDSFFVKHTDGNIWEILDTLVHAGIDAINPLEPTAGMDIEEVKEEYGDQICLIGNIDCGEILSRKTPKEVEQVVRETIHKAAEGGGYIMSSSNEIHASVRPENFLAMIKATKKYGQYT